MNDELKTRCIQFIVQTSSFRHRLPERDSAGKIAVAFVVAIRDREAGVADLTDRV
jgi:hypothetical protein